MQSDTKKLLSLLTNATENIQRINEIEESLRSMSIISAVQYSGDGGVGGGAGCSEVSKVERYVERMIELKDELARCKARLTLVEQIKTDKILTKREYELIEWIQLGGRLSEYAKNKGIYKSTVYKIRDNALKKLLEFVQDSPKCKKLWVKGLT